MGGCFNERFAPTRIPIPTKPRFRSVPDVAVLNSLFRFLRNGSLSADVFQGASFGIGILVGASLLAVFISTLPVPSMDLYLYNLYNTNIHEKIAMEKSKNAVDNG